MATIVLPPDHPLCNPDWQPTTINEGTFEGVNIAQPTWDQAADNIISYDGVLCGDTDIIDWNGSLCATIDIADWDEYTCAGVVFDYLTTTPYAVNLKNYILGTSDELQEEAQFYIYSFTDSLMLGDSVLTEIIWRPMPQGFSQEHITQEQTVLLGKVRGHSGFGEETIHQSFALVSPKIRGVIYDNAISHMTQEQSITGGTMVTE